MRVRLLRPEDDINASVFTPVLGALALDYRRWNVPAYIRSHMPLVSCTIQDPTRDLRRPELDVVTEEWGYITFELVTARPANALIAMVSYSLQLRDAALTFTQKPQWGSALGWESRHLQALEHRVHPLDRGIPLI